MRPSQACSLKVRPGRMWGWPQNNPGSLPGQLTGVWGLVTTWSSVATQTTRSELLQQLLAHIPLADLLRFVACVQEVEGGERRKLEAKLRREAEAQLQRQRDELLRQAQCDTAAAEQRAQQAAERGAEETSIRNRCAIAVVLWPGHTTAGATHHDDMMTSITYQNDYDCQHSTSWWV
jgi:hypothetical protein